MKTTIDIPEPLYRKAKIRAAETGSTLKQIVLTSLGKELDHNATAPTGGNSFTKRRKLLPEFAEFDAKGAFTPSPTDRNITDLISEDRDAR